MTIHNCHPRGFLRTLAGAALAPLVSAARDRRPNVLRVLTYHRVEWPEESSPLDPSTLSGTPEAFAQQAEFLAENFCLVTVEQVIEALGEREPLPPRAVLLTFDDAYRSFARHAWPVLRKLRIPTLLFVPTAFPGEPQRIFWWDALYYAVRRCPDDALAEALARCGPIPWEKDRSRVYGQLVSRLEGRSFRGATQIIEQLQTACDEGPPGGQVLGWEELRQLKSEGLAIGLHTRTHPLLHRLDPEEARVEIAGARDDARRELHEYAPVFAYPGGGYNEDVVKLVESAGFEAAFTTCRGVNVVAKADRYRLRRINVGRRATTADLRLQLSMAPVCLDLLARLQRRLRW